jgi:hypothetical protein
MDLGRIPDDFIQSRSRDCPIDHRRQARPEASALAKPVAQTGKAAIEVGDHFC